MIMGFISFSILLLESSNNTTSSINENEWFDSFHLEHIILLFIGLTFLLQAIVLIYLVKIRNKTLLQYNTTLSETLIIGYLHLHTKGN